MFASVAASTEAVASSITRTLLPLLSRALARQRSCRSPTEKLPPPSLTCCRSRDND